jgi:hypothetical protein
MAVVGKNFAMKFGNVMSVNPTDCCSPVSVRAAPRPGLRAIANGPERRSAVE